MDPTGIPLFALADRRLAWLDQRQGLLSSNIANVDTPHFQARDLQPFDRVLAGAQATLAPVRTDPGHFGGHGEGASPTAPGVAAERAPDGNAVSLDEQLMHIADTDSAHQLVSQLYTKYLGMFRTAIGR